MNLVPLFEEALEFQDYNGTVLSDGKVAVYYIGRTRLADIYTDVDGSVPAENPRILNNLGMGPVYVNPAFDYEMVVFDTYGSELFSVKKYLASKGEHSTANVVVTPSESIAVSAWTVGDVQVYMPYLTGQLGKVYEGIDPIVVNNQVDKISANHVPLGVQDPLYFVQDDEEACIIGFSGEALPEGTMNESAFGYKDGKITGYNGSGFSAGNSYEAGSYVDIDGNTINVTGLQPAGNYQSAGDYVSASELENLQPKGDYYSASNPSGFITGVDLTDYAKTEDLTAYQPVGDYYSASNPSGFINSDSISAMATTGFVADVSGDITALIPSLDGLMSADLLEISDNKITGYNGTAFAGTTVSGDFELSAGSGISIVDYPLEQKTVISVTAQGGNPEVEQAVIDNSATWNTVTAKQDSLTFGYHDTAISSIDESAIYDNSAHACINTLTGRISDLYSNKLDTTAFRDVSGDFLPMVSAGLSASGTYLIDVINNSRILGINTSGISANPNGGVTSVQVGGYNSPEIKIKGYYGIMELNSAGAQYLSFDNSVIWKVGNADHLYVTDKNPDYQNIAIDISQAPRNVDTTRVMIGKNGLSACNIGSSAGMNTTYAPATVVGNSRVQVDYDNMHSVLTVGDVYVQHNGYEASSTWHLTGSVQKREIEGDTATSAITAIAGSAIGGGVPQSAFDEATAKIAELENILSSYSGQWLLA